MKPKGSVPCSQDPITGLYPESDGSRPQPHKLFLQDSFQCYLLNYLFFLPKGIFPSGFRLKLFLICSMRAT